VVKRASTDIRTARLTSTVMIATAQRKRAYGDLSAIRSICRIAMRRSGKRMKWPARHAQFSGRIGHLEVPSDTRQRVSKCSIIKIASQKSHFNKPGPLLYFLQNARSVIGIVRNLHYWSRMARFAGLLTVFMLALSSGQASAQSDVSAPA